MSGANCGSGCTNCPTCRGEVDSPVMQDMSFAMSMLDGPQATDVFMGPLSVAQTVREGARQRGDNFGPERLFLAVGDDLAEGRVAVHGVPPPSPIDITFPSSTAIPDRVWRGGPSQATGLAHGGGGGGGGGAGVLDNVKCCVKKFCYPKKVQFAVKPIEVFGGFNLIIEFDSEAIYEPSGSDETAVALDAAVSTALDEAEKETPGSTYGPNKRGVPTPPPTPLDPSKPDPEAELKCSCPCCVFEQRIELKRLGGNPKNDAEDQKPPSPFGWTSDCIWVKKGEVTKKFWNQPESPGEGWELVCAGRKGKSEEGQKLVMEKWSESECRYEFTDISNWAFQELNFSIEVAWEGRIWDRCRKKVRRLKTFVATFNIQPKKQGPGNDHSATVTADGITSEAPPTPENKNIRVWVNPDKECK